MVQEDIVKVFYWINGENFTFSVLIMKGGLLKLLLDGWESWHAIKKLFKLLFLILKANYPAIS